jgi:hypothetical protein
VASAVVADCTCVCPAGVQPSPVVPDADQSASNATMKLFACVRVTLTVCVLLTAAPSVRTKPVQLPNANACNPRSAVPVPVPAAAETADEPDDPAVAVHACAQQELGVVIAVPSGANVSPVAVGVARVIVWSSVNPITRIRSPEFQVSVPVASGGTTMSFQVEPVCEVSVGAATGSPDQPV